MPTISARQSTEEEDFTQFLDDGASPSDIWPTVAEKIWRLPDGRKRYGSVPWLRKAGLCGEDLQRAVLAIPVATSSVSRLLRYQESLRCSCKQAHRAHGRSNALLVYCSRCATCAGRWAMWGIGCSTQQNQPARMTSLARFGA